MRYQKSCGKTCDDTSVNGLKLSCTRPSSPDKTEILVYNGIWGEWYDWKIAPIGEIAYLFQPKYENDNSCGGWFCDETALNGLIFQTTVYPAIKDVVFEYEVPHNIKNDIFDSWVNCGLKNVVFEYEVPHNINLKPVLIESAEVVNTASTNVTKTISFSKKAQIENKW